MAGQQQTVLAFDAYGTLLSTDSISAQLAAHFGQEKASSISQEWRKHQLEYTWRLNSMNQYAPFSILTRTSLSHALASAHVSLSPAATTALLSAYNTLSLFPDAVPLFPHLASAPHLRAVLFSNGTLDMLSATLAESDLAPHAHFFKDIVTVEPVRKYKPAPEVYRHLCERVGKAGQGEEKHVWVVSGNAFDIVGAKACGLRTCWVDRGEGGWVDGLVEGEGGRPDVVVRGLGEVVAAVGGYLSEE